MTPGCLLLVGPSQIGKDSLIRRLVEERGYSYHVNATTRSPRNPTQGHQEYVFLSVAEFQRRVVEQEWLDWDFYAGNYYGVRPVDVDQLKPVMHCGAGMSIRIAARNPAYVPIFLEPTDIGLHRNRITATFGPQESARRLEMLDEELAHRPMFRHIVPVQDYASADSVVDEIVSIHRRVAEQT